MAESAVAEHAPPSVESGGAGDWCGAGEGFEGFGLGEAGVSSEPQFPVTRVVSNPTLGNNCSVRMVGVGAVTQCGGDLAAIRPTALGT